MLSGRVEAGDPSASEKCCGNPAKFSNEAPRHS